MSRVAGLALPDYEPDPVLAYDRLAPEYEGFSKHRESYLRAVEDAIISRVPTIASSLLDLGAGDGKRTLRIATAAGIQRTVLLEPSPLMAKQAPSHTELWPMRAEDIDAGSISEHFDVITCLWNVLGHVRRTDERIRALENVRGILSPHGIFFLDVTHRYNARSYGWVPSVFRWMKDELAHEYANGDVVVAWDVDHAIISTYGHVFTNREILFLAWTAGLELQERLVIDYTNGKRRRFSWQGNLLYVFRRSS